MGIENRAIRRPGDDGIGKELLPERKGKQCQNGDGDNGAEEYFPEEGEQG